MFARPTLIAAGLSLSLAAFAPSSAEAHRRWLLPSATVLSGDEELVTVDAAASNGLFVFEHRPLGLDSLKVIGPDGQPVDAKVIGEGSYRSVFDLPLKKQGTYRIALVNDGMMGSYELNGERRRWRGTRASMATDIPAEATNVRVSENSGRIETFVTLGAPNDTALAPVGSGIEMLPVGSPNDLVAGEPAQMKFVLDGQPAAGLKVEFVQGGTRYRDEAGLRTLTTDADGMVTLAADEPGFYYVEANHSSAGAAQTDGGGAPDKRSAYTAVLEFLPL